MRQVTWISFHHQCPVCQIIGPWLLPYSLLITHKYNIHYTYSRSRQNFHHYWDYSDIWSWFDLYLSADKIFHKVDICFHVPSEKCKDLHRFCSKCANCWICLGQWAASAAVRRTNEGAGCVLPGYITAAEHQSHSVRLWSQSQQQVDSGSGAGAGKAGAVSPEQPQLVTSRVWPLAVWLRDSVTVWPGPGAVTLSHTQQQHSSCEILEYYPLPRPAAAWPAVWSMFVGRSRIPAPRQKFSDYVIRLRLLPPTRFAGPGPDQVSIQLLQSPYYFNPT